MKKSFHDYLTDLEACDGAVRWVGKQSRKTAWRKCKRGDWMLWLVLKENLLDDKQLRLFAADCAEHVLPIFEKEYPNDDHPRLAIQAARDFANGKISKQELDAARDAARAAARAAARDDAWAAVWDAAWAAARDDAWAAARDAARAAARDDAWAAARDAELLWQANKLREYLPTEGGGK